MGSSRTIAIRLTLEEANQFQAAMKAAGTDGQNALKAIGTSADATSVSSGKVSGSVSGFTKAANDGGASLTSLTGKLDAARTGYLAMAAAAQQAAVSEAAAASNRATVAAAQARQGANQYANAGYTSRAGDLEAAFAASDKLRASLVPLAAAEQQHAAQLARIAQAEKTGVITAAEATTARTAAQKTFTAQTSALNDNAKAHHGVTEAGKLANYQLIEIAETAHKFADQVISGGSAVKGLAYELPNAIGIAGGFSNALAAIGRNIPLIGLAAGAAGLVALGVAADENESRLAKLGQQARATRDDYGTYAKTLDDVARSLALTTTIGTKDARATVNSIGLDANFGGTSEDIKRLATDAHNLSVVLKTDLAGGTKVITDGLDNTAKAAKDLAEKGFAGFTPQLVRQVDLFQSSGKYAEAFALYLKTLEDRSSGATRGGLTSLGQALADLRASLSKTREDGHSFSEDIGGFFDSVATRAVKATTKIINTLADLRAAVQQGGLSAENLATGGGNSDGMPAFMGGARAVPGVLFPGMHAPPAGAAVPDPPAYTAQRDSIAREYGVDPSLIALLNHTEGHRNPDGQFQVSSAGAIGGFQLLPGTFADMQQKYKFRGGINDDEANTRAGVLYYRDQLQHEGGDPTKAYYDYHDGPAAPYTSQAAIFAAGTGGIGQFRGRPLIAPTGTDAASGGYAGAAGADGIVNGSRKDAEDLDKQIQGTRSLKTEQLAAEMADIQRQLQKLETSGQQDSPEYRGLLEKEQTTRAATYNNVDPQTEATRATQRQLDSNRLARRFGFTPADDALSASLAQREDIARTTGSPVTPEVRQQATAQFYEKANAELDRLAKTQQQATKGQEELAAAYLKGNAAVAEATARNQALHQIGSVLPSDAANYRARLDELTEGYRKAAIGAADLKAAQAVDSDKTAIGALQEQERLIRSGAGPNQTATALAEYSARQKAEGASPAKQAEAVDAARQRATEEQSLQGLKANSNELTTFADSAADKIGSSLTSAFASGRNAPISFGSITKSVLSELEQEFVKLAVINPLKNAIQGGNSALPTLGGVASSVFGSFFGGSSYAGSTATTAANGAGQAFGLIGHIHGGGIAGSEYTFAKAVDPSLFYGARRMHTGGIAGDETPAVLKVGEGVFTPGQMAALGANMGDSNQQAMGDLHLHINAQGAGPREVDTLRTQMPLIALQAVQSAMTRGGSFAKSVRGG